METSETNIFHYALLRQILLALRWWSDSFIYKFGFKCVQAIDSWIIIRLSKKIYLTKTFQLNKIGGTLIQ